MNEARCPRCEGDGRDPINKDHYCLACGGSGLAGEPYWWAIGTVLGLVAIAVIYSSTL